MHTGKINKIARDRGFGFIDATDGREIFFHSNNLIDVDFEDLKSDLAVQFDVEKSRRGPKAINIRLIAGEIK